MFCYDDNLGWWGYAGMGVGMVLFWALLIVGILALVRFSTVDRQARSITAPPAPQQVLADRFARGEITETEYRDQLAVLRNHAHP